jgi:carboxymethylenebutenolidase
VRKTVEFAGISGYLAGDGPGIVVFHEWWGLVPHIIDICDRLAALGFTALAPDVYHGATASSNDEAEELQKEFDREGAVAEAVETVGELRRRGCERVGTIGFCMGGSLSLATSAACPVDATVAYYGIWPKSGEHSITNPILVHVAEHEEHNWTATPEQFPKWFAGMSNAEIHIYWGTQHAFFNDTRPERYDEAAANLSWDRTVAFFREHLAS